MAWVCSAGAVLEALETKAVADRVGRVTPAGSLVAKKRAGLLFESKNKHN